MPLTWVRPSNLSLSREPFSYTYCKGLQVFPLVHGSFHVISTQQGASFAGARNHSFSKIYIQVPRGCFPSLFLAVVMHHMHERAWARNQPSPVKMKPSSETIYIYMSFARSERKRTTKHDCLSYSRPYLCHRLLVIRVRFLLRYFVMFNLSPLNLSWNIFFQLNVTSLPPSMKSCWIQGIWLKPSSVLRYYAFCIATTLTMILSTNFFDIQ